MLSEENLVLCTETFKTETTKFEKGKVYRCLPHSEDDNIQLLIYGVVFDLVGFASKFQFAYNTIIKEWTELVLIVNGKPISKTEFKKRLDCRKYGHGKGSFYAGYISKGHPKELCYQFNTNYS